MTSVLALAVAAVLAALERIASLRFRSSRLFRPRFWTDAWYLVTGYVAPAAVTIAYVQAGSAVVGSLGIPRASDLRLSPWIATAVALILLDLGNYAAHSLMHSSDSLWEFHKAHHSSPALDWMATFRSHPVEQVLRHALAPAGLILAGLPIEAVAGASAILNSWAMFIHSNLDVDLRAIEPVLVTPRLHRLHHVPSAAGSNFGTLLTIWDRLSRDRFATSDVAPDVPLGVPGETRSYPQGWLAQVIEPFRRLGSRSNPGAV